MGDYKKQKEEEESLLVWYFKSVAKIIFCRRKHYLPIHLECKQSTIFIILANGLASHLLLLSPDGGGVWTICVEKSVKNSPPSGAIKVCVVTVLPSDQY